MRRYEAVLVVAPTVEEQELQGLIAKARQAIEGRGGALHSVEPWGKRRLAYDIRHHKEGIYLLLRFEAPADGTSELRHFCRISEQVLRHLIVAAVEGSAARPDARGEEVESAGGSEHSATA